MPSAAAPAGGYPVTIYGHGLTRTRTDGFVLSSALATAGQVMIAIDEPWHGDRNTCKGFGAFLTSAGIPGGQDAFACSNPAAQTCNAVGRCQSTDRSGALACAPSGPGMTIESLEGPRKEVRRWPLRVLRFTTSRGLDTGWKILPASDWNGD